MQGGDTTVYSIFAGYVPTMGYARSDFKYKRSAGTKRVTPQGTRYDGNYQYIKPYHGVRNDGKLGMTRLRGSIAWYEYSTNISAINTEIQDNDKLKEFLKKGAKEWYSTTSGSYQFSSETLWKEFARGGGMLGPTGLLWPSGETVEGGNKGEPEEQQLSPEGKGGHEGSGGGRQQWKPDDDKMRAEKRIFGSANSIDVYMRGRDGGIYRLDVTAMTMDKKSAHHGLTTHADRKKKGVTGQQLLKLIEKDGRGAAETRLLRYFRGVQNKSWNPPIRRMREALYKHGSQKTKDTLQALKKKEMSLADLTKKDEQLLLEMRGGGSMAPRMPKKVRGGTTMTSKQGSKRGSKKQMMKVIRQHARNRRWHAIAPARRASGHAAFSSGVSFSLHMLGNVLELFRSDSERQGGYSTGYTMGKGDAANFVIEVKHSIHAAGKNVFEFMHLEKGMVRVREEATLTAHYMKDLWYEGKETDRAILVDVGTRKNQLAAKNVFGSSVSSVEIGTLVHSANEDFIARSGPSHTAESTGAIMPKKLNETIDAWINTVKVGPRKGKEGDLYKKLRDTLDENVREAITPKQQRRPRGFHDEDPLKAADPMMMGENMEEAMGGLGRFLKASGRTDADLLPFTGRSLGDYNYHSARTSSAVQSANKNLFDSGQRPTNFNVDFRTSDFQGRELARADAALAQVLGLSHKPDSYNNIIKFLTADHRGAEFPYKQTPDFGLRAQGVSIARGTKGSQPWQKRMPSFWAAPYLGILYPSTQVRVA